MPLGISVELPSGSLFPVGSVKANRLLWRVSYSETIALNLNSKDFIDISVHLNPVNNFIDIYKNLNANDKIESITVLVETVIETINGN